LSRVLGTQLGGLGVGFWVVGFWVGRFCVGAADPNAALLITHYLKPDHLFNAGNPGAAIIAKRDGA